MPTTGMSYMGRRGRASRNDDEMLELPTQTPVAPGTSMPAGLLNRGTSAPRAFVSANGEPSAAPSPQDFVNQAYQNLLGRAPDAGGAEYFTGLLQGGASMADIGKAIAKSPEAIAYRESQQARANAQPQVNIANPATPVPAMAAAPVETPAPQQPVIMQSVAQPQATQAQPINAGAAATAQAQANEANVAAVNELYNQYLGRDGSAEYMQAWADQIAAGVPVEQVAAAIASSPEGQAYAAQQSTATTDTPATQTPATQTPAAEPAATGPALSVDNQNTLLAVQDGLDSGLLTLEEAAGVLGVSVDELSGALGGDSQTPVTDPADSDTPVTSSGVTAEEVQALYQALLGRPGADEFVQSWVNSGMSRDEIIAAIRQSPEYQESASVVTAEQVQGIYQNLLGRSGADEFIQGWVDSGMSLAEIEASIRQSPEFLEAQDGAQGTADGDGSDNYVSTDGLNYNINELYAVADALKSNLVTAQEAAEVLGVSVEQLITALGPLDQEAADIAGSGEDTDTGDEFDEATATDQIKAFYQSFLGRDPAPEFLELWLEEMRNGATLDEVRSGFANSAEYESIAIGAINGFFQEHAGALPGESNLSAYLALAKDGVTLPEIEQLIIDAFGSQGGDDTGDTGDTGGDDTGGGNTETTEPAPQVPTPTQTTAQEAVDSAQTYEPVTVADSGAAKAVSADVAQREITDDELVENRLQDLLDSDNPLLARARTRGMQMANARGLLNSSIAAQAAEEAAYNQAFQIASQDADTYRQAASQNVDAQNRANLQDASLGTNVNIFNVGEQNVTNRFNAESVNEAGQFNANAANIALQNFLERENQRILQEDQQLFTAEENEADRILRELLQERQFDFQSSENSLDRELQTALQQNQFTFTSGENELDRNLQTNLQQNQFGENQRDRDFTGDQNQLERDLREALQQNQFSFQGGENALDRALSQTLQQNQFGFQGTQNQLDRDLSQTMQQQQFAFQSGESALDRALQVSMQQTDQDFRSFMQQNQNAFAASENAADRAFNQMMQESQNSFMKYMQEQEQEWRSLENALQRDFAIYQTNAQTAASIMYSTMDSIASIYGDPNLTPAQKTAAVTNVQNMAASMPQLLSVIASTMPQTAGQTSGTDTATSDTDTATSDTDTGTSDTDTGTSTNTGTTNNETWDPTNGGNSTNTAGMTVVPNTDGAVFRGPDGRYYRLEGGQYVPIPIDGVP